MIPKSIMREENSNQEDPFKGYQGQARHKETDGYSTN